MENRKFTILLLDDLENNLISVETLILENFDVDVLKAYNGEEGLRIILKNKIDLILSDVQMPVMNGFEFARALSETPKYKSIPLIFLTAMHITDEFVKQGLSLGAVDYIIKPINSTIFIAKLKVFINLFNTKNNLQNVNEALLLEIEKNAQQEAYMLTQARSAQMGEMISMIAHQWRQPLSSISSITNTLLLDIMIGEIDHSFLKERLTSIANLSVHLSSTIDDFRNFFRSDKNKEIFYLHTAVDETLTFLESTLQDITVIKEMKNSDPVNSYKSEILQVFLNIIQNSIDAFQSNNIKERKILIRGYTNLDGSNILTFEDNAGGISNNILAKIFDPYFSTKSKNGTGLGLYMSKLIIEDHCNGLIHVKNTSEGAIFTLEFFNVTQ